MFKTLDPADVNITPFKVYKEFTVTNTDSGSGVYGFKAVSGSTHSFTQTAAASEVTTFDSASFYFTPSWQILNHMYYRDTQNPFNNFGQNDDMVKFYLLLKLDSLSVLYIRLFAFLNLNHFLFVDL